MTVFSIIAVRNSEILMRKASEVFKDDFLKLTPDSALVSAPLTAVQLTERLGLLNKPDQAPEVDASAIILSGSSYYGRATPQIWEWLKNKWSTP